ncbi:TonB-dependent receptor [Flavobacteriaceae bacterium CRH]|nr:TonB-dependent receptor [Flavobacteriaceae bacterium CRH]
MVKESDFYNGLRKVVFVIILLLQMQVSNAQIRGVIKDEATGKPLETASIVLRSSGEHTHSLADGSFSLLVKNVPDTLIVSHAEFEQKTIIIANTDQKFTIDLERSGIKLSDVVVSSSKFLIGQIMKVDLKMTPVNSAQDLLRKVPGLFIAQHAGGGKAEQIFLRGFDADHGTDVNITVDGLPVNMPSHAHGQGYSDLHFVIPETVKDIDFGKGSYYADKGDFCTAGYVNFSTFDRVDNSMFKLETGSFNTIRTVGVFNLLPKEITNKSAYIAGEYNFTNGPFEVKQNFNRLNLFAKYDAKISDKNYIKFQASTFNSSWNASGQIPERAVAQDIVSRWGSIDPSEGGNTSRTNLSFQYKHKIDEYKDWQSFFFYSKYAFNLYSDFTFYAKDYINGDEINQIDNRNIYGYDHKYTQKIFLKNSNIVWESGTGLRMDDITNLQLNHVYRRNTLLDQITDASATETNLNLYTQAEWHSGKWLVNPSIRLDYFIFNYFDRLSSLGTTQGQQATKISPKLNVFYTVDSKLQLYAKAGKGFHSNDVRVVIAQSGHDVLPSSIGADLGAVIKPLPGLYIQPALWWLDLEQEFVFSGDEGTWEPSGKTRRLGIDLSLRYQPLKWLYIDIDGNYAKPRFTDEAAGQNYIPLAPTFTSTGGISAKFSSGISANLRYRYMADRPANEDYSLTAKGYFVNDLILTYTKKNWEFNIQMQNLFNVKWYEAQFETVSKLKNETVPVDDINFTPGTPFYFKTGIKFNF